MKEEIKNLILENGRPNFGVHDEPFLNLDLAELRLYGSEFRQNIQRYLTLRYRIKRWEYIGVCNEEMIFGMAMVNLGYLSSMFAYVFDRVNRQIRKYEIALPGNKIGFFGSSRKGVISLERKYLKICFTHDGVNTHIKAAIKLEQDELLAELTMKNSAAPLVYVGRVGLKGFNYTHKEAGIAVSGKIKLGGKEWLIAPQNSFGGMDYTLGQLARNTFWNWAAGGGLDKKGNRLGFNLVQGINETGNTENALWINDRLIKVDLTHFDYIDLKTSEAWKLTSADGKVNLNFQPEGEHSANNNYGFIISRFKQPFGSFHGEISDGNTTYELAQVFGFTEEHFAKW